MLSILLTGIATLDIINQLDHYPAEDSEVRAIQQSRRVGGNASNSAIVLSQLEINAHLLCNRADDISADFIFNQLKKQHVDTSLCPIANNSVSPTSYITLNAQNGSRSIIHYRDLAELADSHFCQLDLSIFDWLHFEARNCRQMLSMLKHAQSFNKPISIEIEKDRDNLDKILPFANVLLISKDFAKHRGFSNAINCLQHFSQIYPNAIITCTWGEQGVWAYFDANILHPAPIKLSQVVDTLGAGDTFNAGLISCLVKQRSFPQALQFANQLAANKCQQIGFEQLIIPQ